MELYDINNKLIEKFDNVLITYDEELNSLASYRGSHNGIHEFKDISGEFSLSQQFIDKTGIKFEKIKSY